MHNLPTVQVRAGYDPLPTGEYNAKLTSIEAVDGQYGTQVKFTFELTDLAHSGRRLTVYARLSDSLKGKLAQYVGAILGRPLQAGEVINWDALMNRPARLVVVKAVKPDGMVYNRVQEVLPAPVQAQAQPQASPTPPPAPADAGDPFAQ